MINYLFLILTIVVVTCAVVFLIFLFVRKKSGFATFFPISREAPRLPTRPSRRGRPRDKEVYDKCCDYMAHSKPFLLQDFRLDDLARGVYMNITYLSRSINRYYGDFRMWVNEHRVNYAKEIFLRNPSLRVAELASLCGFKSLSTFNLSFKLFNGMSPSNWCTKVKLEIESGASRKELVQKLQYGHPLRGAKK